jgi:hypothetical protein
VHQAQWSPNQGRQESEEVMLRVRGFSVRVENDGETFTASASLCDGVVIVWIENASKQSPIGNRSAEVVGSMLLKELLLEGKC